MSCDEEAGDPLLSSETPPPVGLLYQMWETPERSTTELARRALDEFVLADELGYASIWVGEHHFVKDTAFYGRVPIPELLLARMAATTRRIRVGTGVKILPGTDAVRAAEEMAMLDLVCDGRADFGLGQGTSTPSTTEEERSTKQRAFRERLTDVLMLLRGEHTERLPQLNVGPVDNVESKIWAACRDTETIELVAQLGVGLVVGQAEVAEAQASYIARYRAMGGRGEVRGVRAVFVAPTREEAEASYTQALGIYESVIGAGRYANDAAADGLLPDSAESSLLRRRRACLVVGDPDDVTAQLLDYVGTTGVDRLDLLVQFPGMDPAQTTRTLTLFRDHVQPRLGGVLAHA